MPSQQRPISLIGFLSGLVSGLAISVAIALYLTNAPVPFVTKVQHATESVTPEPGDPNRPLYSPLIPSPASTDSAGARAPGAAAPDSADAATAATKPAVAAERAAPAATGAAVAPAAVAAAAPDANGRLMLQVGAFKSADDADVVRARLALLGLDATVSPVQTDNVTLYRVRLGPFGRLDDLNGIRQTLSENGIEAQLVQAR